MAIETKLGRSMENAVVVKRDETKMNFARLGIVINQLDLAIRQPRLLINDHFESVVNEIDIDTEMIIQRLNDDEASLAKLERLNERREEMISILNDCKLDVLNQYDANKFNQSTASYDILGLKKTFEKLSSYFIANEKISADNTPLNQPILQLLAVLEPKLTLAKQSLMANRTVLFLRNGKEFENKFDLLPKKYAEKSFNDIGCLIFIDNLFLNEQEMFILNLMATIQSQSWNEDSEDDSFIRIKQPDYYLFQDLDFNIKHYNLTNIRFGKVFLIIIEILKTLAQNKNEKIFRFSYDSLYNRLKALEVVEAFFVRQNQIDQTAFDSTFKELSCLTVIKSDIELILDNQFGQLENLVQLNLRENRLSQLPTGAFKGLSKLRILNLSQNQFTVFEPDHFKPLENLEQLILSENQISSLNPDLFQYNTNLKLLYINHNKFEKLTAGMFQSLVNLLELDLSSNQIALIEPSSFAGLSNLKTINLSGNQLEGLRARQFDRLTNLEELYLQQNKISDMELDAFYGLTNLRKLYLTFNTITRLIDNQFMYLVNLNELFLSFNLIDHIDKHAFNDLGQLKTLYLSDNQLNHLGANQFEHLTALEKLYLTWNQISFVDRKAFQGLTRLTELDIRVNRLRTITEKQFKSDLETDLDGCNIHF